MKRFYKLLLLAFLAFLASSASAYYDFKVGGLCYNINSDGNSVTVTYENTYSPRYSNASDSLIIPSSVTRYGKTYSVTAIGDHAFSECSGFTGPLTIPNSITTIGKSAFSGCSGFTGPLTIPNSITTIGKSAFSGCSGFTGPLTIPNSVSTINEGTFNNCSGFTSLTLPESLIEIGKDAFKECSGFTGSLIFPESLIRIGDYAFQGCCGFTGRLVFPKKMTEIGQYAFYGCSGFTGSLVIPDAVGYVDDCTFYDCTGFNGDLSFGKNCCALGEDAFARSDDGLTDIKSMHIYYSKDVVTAGWFDGTPFGYNLHDSHGNPIPYSRVSGLNPNITIYVPKSLLEKYRSRATGDPFMDPEVSWWGYFSPDCFFALEDEGQDLQRGDLTGDGLVDVDDLNIVINVMVRKAAMADWPAADLDGNGVVDIDDLNRIINIMVHKE